MINATQELIAQFDRSTLSVLTIAAALGSRQHRVLFVHRREGQIVSVEDYDCTQTRYLIQDIIHDGEILIAQYETCLAPESRCQVRTVTSSDGDFCVEFLKEKTAVKKTSTGYEILRRLADASPGASNTGSTAIIAL